MKLKGTLKVPGDKSITHRGIIFSALSRGTCRLTGVSPAADCRNTLACLQRLGLEATTDDNDSITIVCEGGLRAPKKVLDAGNSGSTMRMVAGLVAGQPFTSSFDGDESLRRRPMARILNYLKEMGANVNYLDRENFAPFEIEGQELHGIDALLPVASAQLETSLLVAGLFAKGKTSVRLPAEVRDHTTRLLSYIGVPIRRVDNLTVEVETLAEPCAPFSLSVPGDPSSAAFFMVAAALVPGSDVTLLNVGLNPGRTLAIEVLQEMGADVEVTDSIESAGEPVGNIRVRYAGRLKGVTIGGDRIARGIDEIPILAIAGALCDGVFDVQGAEELRVKESDRIALLTANLKVQGVKVSDRTDGFTIAGKSSCKGGALWRTAGDHRMAMTGAIAGLAFQNPPLVDDIECTAVSYPHFTADLSTLFCE